MTGVSPGIIQYSSTNLRRNRSKSVIGDREICCYDLPGELNPRKHNGLPTKLQFPKMHNYMLYQYTCQYTLFQNIHHYIIEKFKKQKNGLMQMNK